MCVCVCFKKKLLEFVQLLLCPFPEESYMVFKVGIVQYVAVGAKEK